MSQLDHEQHEAVQPECLRYARNGHGGAEVRCQLRVQKATLTRDPFALRLKPTPSGLSRIAPTSLRQSLIRTSELIGMNAYPVRQTVVPVARVNLLAKASREVSENVAAEPGRAGRQNGWPVMFLPVDGQFR